VIDDAALEYLVGYVAREQWTNPFVVMDVNTADVAGANVVAELGRAGISVRHHTYQESSGLLADELGVGRLEAALQSSTSDVLIAVGSGVITDLTRFVAHSRGMSFISVPTAASMDGYASGVAAMEFHGMKTTSIAVAPSAIFADPRVIASAPQVMTRSGVGDLLGKASAHIDWRLSHELFGEDLCEVVERRVTEPMVDVANHVHEIVGRSRASTAQLLRGLVESGIAMAMIGSSRPASGCEHHASHFWDLLAQRGQHHHAPHGLQVGFATHFALRLQRWALAEARELPRAPGPREPESEQARSWFVGHRDQVDAVLAEKARFLSTHEHAWPKSQAEWDNVRLGSKLEQGRSLLIDDALVAAGIPFEIGYLDLDASTLAATFRYANRIRARYTVIDFLEAQGLLVEAITAVMNEVGTPFAP
jgi:glycerol-1-phosphate dehydrogenase [NAD(P)+]